MQLLYKRTTTRRPRITQKTYSDNFSMSTLGMGDGHHDVIRRRDLKSAAKRAKLHKLPTLIAAEQTSSSSLMQPDPIPNNGN